MIRKTRNRKYRNRRTRKRSGGGLGFAGKLALGAAGLAMASGHKIAPAPPRFAPNYTNPNVSQYMPYKGAMNRLAMIPNVPVTNVSSIPGPLTNVAIPVANAPADISIKCGVSRKTCIERNIKYIRYLLNKYPGLKLDQIRFR